VDVPVTDVHTVEDSTVAVVDVLQTPAFLCRQTDFIRPSRAEQAGEHQGQFLAPG
jgi:2-dehydro-3-deoxyphosphooctonate aldolase (KDO 8-P synthase)